ncbi:MAG: FAD:protein FMN transferase [Planctomycetes bacterium]|nr:FAD:protein FMN transferase [Planctomycetota bacterium]
MPRCFRIALAIALALSFACRSAPSSEQRVELEAPAMGTLFRVVLYAHDAAAGERAARAALERVAELERALSDYREDSELVRLGARSDAQAPTEWVELSADLERVLRASQQLAGLTDDAFDVTVGPLSALWRRARRQQELPRTDRLAAALEACGWSKLELDPLAPRARLLAPRMRLDLGGIAKGYALDQALALLQREGFERAMVVGGGDVVAGRGPPSQPGWRVVIAPFDDERERVELHLEHSAVSTSGDAFQVLELDGKRWSHIVDPRSGWALATRTSASVIAPYATLSDALATALCVLGPEGLAKLRHFDGVEARVVRELEHGFERTATPGFASVR